MNKKLKMKMKNILMGLDSMTFLSISIANAFFSLATNGKTSTKNWRIIVVCVLGVGAYTVLYKRRRNKSPTVRIELMKI